MVGLCGGRNVRVYLQVGLPYLSSFLIQCLCIREKIEIMSYEPVLFVISAVPEGLPFWVVSSLRAGFLGQRNHGVPSGQTLTRPQTRPQAMA